MIVKVRSIIGQKIKINHDRKLFRLKVKHSYNLKKRRRLEQGIPKIVCGSIRKHKYDGYISVSAPTCFSAVDNETQTLRFIQEVRKLYEKRQKVFVVLKNVSYITNDAILLLLANMIRFRAANLKFNGDYPTNRQVRDKLIASGFFRHLYDKVRNEDKYNLSESGGLIYTHAHKIVDSVQADLIVKDASQFIWGTPQRCLGVQRTFVELMQNTHNHASQKRKGEHHWWVSLSKDESKKNVSISFLDFGLGIFNSLFNKKEGDQFYGWQQNMYKLFPLSKSNDQLLRLILKGELHKSATKKLYRGKGLPGIYEAAQNNKISALHIISNNVSANIERDDYHLLKNSFDGTLVSFEINYNTIHFPWTI